MTDPLNNQELLSAAKLLLFYKVQTASIIVLSSEEKLINSTCNKAMSTIPVNFAHSKHPKNRNSQAIWVKYKCNDESYNNQI